MKEVVFFCLTFFFLSSCNRNVAGVYNTSYRGASNVFHQIKLNPDGTVEKKVIHTICIEEFGKWKQRGHFITCLLDSSATGFPPDTISLKRKGKRLFYIRKGERNRFFYLKKV